MHYDDLRPVQLIVTIWIDPDANVAEVVNEMDYSFDHDAIKEYEIRDINTEI
jgi:hypothetical protein